jgi:hypothetical protein
LRGTLKLRVEISREPLGHAHTFHSFLSTHAALYLYQLVVALPRM